MKWWGPRSGGENGMWVLVWYMEWNSGGMGNYGVVMCNGMRVMEWVYVYRCCMGGIAIRSPNK